MLNVCIIIGTGKHKEKVTFLTCNKRKFFYNFFFMI